MLTVEEKSVLIRNRVTYTETLFSQIPTSEESIYIGEEKTVYIPIVQQILVQNLNLEHLLNFQLRKVEGISETLS